MEQQMNVLSPFLGKAETLLVLLVVLLLSVAWLFWEIFSYAQGESEEANHDWWEALKSCPHRRLIIPPHCVEEVPELGALSRLTTATTNAVKNMTGVVSSSIQRTSNLISGGSKPLTKAAKKASRQNLSAAGEDGSSTGRGSGPSTGKVKRCKGSRQQLAGADADQKATASPGPGQAGGQGAARPSPTTTPDSVNGSGGRPKPDPHRLDLSTETAAASPGEGGNGGGGPMMAEVVRALPHRRSSDKGVEGSPVGGSGGGAMTRARRRFSSPPPPPPQQQQQLLHEGEQRRDSSGYAKLGSPAAIAVPEAKAVLAEEPGAEQGKGGAALPPTASSASSPALQGEPLHTPPVQPGAAGKRSSVSGSAGAGGGASGSAATAASALVSSSGGGAAAAPGAGAAAGAAGATGAAGAGVGGYVFHPIPEDCTPLLAFVNSRSGVSQGAFLIHQLRRLLNPVQVVDLANEDPARALRQFLELPRLRILVCGGDGTAKWIMGVLEELEIDCWPPIAILPLGTGNDMARVLGWGGGYNNESIVEFLAQVQRAHVVVVDRWEMRLASVGKAGKAGKERAITFNNYFGIGVDAQAALKFHHLRETKPQLFFSRLVNKLWYGALGAQDLFRRTCVNLPDHLKIVADGKELRLPPSVQGVIFLNIESYGGGVKLWNVEDGEEGGSLDGYEEDDEASDDEVADAAWRRRGPAYRGRRGGGSGGNGGHGLGLGHGNGWRPASGGRGPRAFQQKQQQQRQQHQQHQQQQQHGRGGSRHRAHEDEDDWPSSSSASSSSLSSSSGGGASVFQAASMQDGMLEVVAVNGVVHLGQLQVGLSKAVKICQCREVVITTSKDLPMQVDGEPWGQPKGVVRISRKKDPALMLKRTMDSGGAVCSEMANLLDWALNEGVISLPQKKSLLTEFSRRVESKRRVFEQELSGATLEGGVPSLTKGFDVAKLRLATDAHGHDCAVM